MKRPFQMSNTFSVGDKVKSNRYGVGDIIRIDNDWLYVYFASYPNPDTGFTFTHNGHFTISDDPNPVYDIRHLSKLERQLK